MEVEVLERVVLGADRDAVVARRRRDAVGERPRGEHAVVLQPQVPVQARRVVLLDDEARRAARRRAVAAAGSGVAPKSPLLPIVASWSATR